MEKQNYTIKTAMKPPTPPKQKVQSEPSSKPSGRHRCSAQNEDDSHNDSEDGAETANMENSDETLPPRSRPKNSKNLKQSPRIILNAPEKGQSTSTKRRKREQPLAAMDEQKIKAETYVMKLFDRSLDFFKYTEQTPLYPICRAWMANQPHNPSIRSYREHKSPELTKREDSSGLDILTKLRSGEMTEVYAMPPPAKTELAAIPTPLPKDIHDEAEDKVDDLSKDNLMAEHKIRWNKVKDNWRSHRMNYQKRYEVNELILKELMKP